MNNRVKVSLDTNTQLNTFVEICGKQSFPVYLEDGSHEFRVSAKSTLGCILAKMEWEEIYCEYEGEKNMEFEHELNMNKLLSV